MSLGDILEDIIRPYGGTEESPYAWLRVGSITKVYASKEDVEDDQQADRVVGTVRVVWLDRGSPSDQLVRWTYAAFSNPLINKTQQDVNTTNQTPGTKVVQTSVGSSSGIFFIPSIGDVIVCGFRSPSEPVVLGFLPHNLNQQLESRATGGDRSFGPFRKLVSGEYEIRSERQADIYLDRKGSIQFVVKSQVSDSTVPVTELGRVSLGVTYDDVNFTTPVTSSYGNNVVCNISLVSGAKVQIDSLGNVEIASTGKTRMVSESDLDVQSFATGHLGANQSLSLAAGTVLSVGSPTMLLSAPNGITMQGSTVTINSGTQGVARKEDQTLSNSVTDAAWWSWWSLLQAQITALPTTPLDGGATLKAGLAALFGTVPTSITGKINTASSTVKSG